jgi:hypothetical protein
VLERWAGYLEILWFGITQSTLDMLMFGIVLGVMDGLWYLGNGVAA